MPQPRLETSGGKWKSGTSTPKVGRACRLPGALQRVPCFRRLRRSAQAGRPPYFAHAEARSRRGNEAEITALQPIPPRHVGGYENEVTALDQIQKKGYAGNKAVTCPCQGYRHENQITCSVVGGPMEPIPRPGNGNFCFADS